MFLKGSQTVINGAVGFLAVLLAFSILFGVAERRNLPTVGTPRAPHIVIDAGHGGEDGGACAPDGVAEKHINLAVSRTLSDLLRVMGFTVTETRVDDTMLNTDGNTLRERKVSDMKYRLSVYETADLTISIHQNHFSQSKYFGAQVFYSKSDPVSAVFAEQIRQSTVSLLQPENTRPLKAADDTIYLLSRTTRPAVLVECGFLSNPQESKRLQDPVYQHKLALAIFGGIVQ